MELDWAILDAIQNLIGGSFMDAVMPKITALGNGGLIWIIIGVVLLISKKHRKAGIFVLAGLLIGLIIGNGLIKNLVQRERPCWINQDFNLLIPSPKDYSFPSGHTQASAIAATIITLYRKKWGAVVIPIAALIAFSRMYLYVHFPTDILGGAVIGITIGVLTFMMGNKIVSAIKDKSGN